jgi:hypothetical protein
MCSQISLSIELDKGTITHAEGSRLYQLFGAPALLAFKLDNPVILPSVALLACSDDFGDTFGDENKVHKAAFISQLMSLAGSVAVHAAVVSDSLFRNVTRDEDLFLRARRRFAQTLFDNQDQLCSNASCRRKLVLADPNVPSTLNRKEPRSMSISTWDSRAAYQKYLGDLDWMASSSSERNDLFDCLWILSQVRDQVQMLPIAHRSQVRSLQNYRPQLQLGRPLRALQWLQDWEGKGDGRRLGSRLPADDGRR